MYFNNRGNYRVYGPGCSLFGCMIGLIIFSFIVRGSLYFFFRYFWLILVVGLIVWVFRKLTSQNNNHTTNTENENSQPKSNWSRDFENRSDTSYHNVDREFEEVEEDEDDEFDDF